MMFVGFRMRVLQLSKGTGNPQDWVRMSMQAVTYSILANTLLVLLVPLFTSKSIATTKEGDLDLEAKSPFESPALAGALRGPRSRGQEPLREPCTRDDLQRCAVPHFPWSLRGFRRCLRGGVQVRASGGRP